MFWKFGNLGVILSATQQFFSSQEFTYIKKPPLPPDMDVQWFNGLQHNYYVTNAFFKVNY